MATKNAIVLGGDGINCHRETAAACEMVGFSVDLLHVNDFLQSPERWLNRARLLVLPGGFSFGDELGSGRILALKLRGRAGSQLDRFLDNGGAMLGICNWFQVLVAMEIFGRSVALAHNANGGFIDRWVTLNITGESIFTKHLPRTTRLELPIRHGEGRLVCTDDAAWSTFRDSQALVLSYASDVNGSRDQVAGLSAREGRVLGLMPHPEAFWSSELHPASKDEKLTLGTELFAGAFKQL